MRTLFVPESGHRRAWGLLPPKSKAIQIPDSWRDVTLRQFVFLCTCEEDYDDPSTAKFSILSGLTWGECLDLPIAFIHAGIDSLDFLKKVYAPAPGMPRDVEFTLPNGKTYVFFPSWKENPLSRYILTENLILKRIEELERLRQGNFTRLSMMIALLCSPKGEPTEILDFRAQAKEFEAMSCVDALDILVFFLRGSKLCAVSLESCFRIPKKRRPTKKKPITRGLLGALRWPS